MNYQPDVLDHVFTLAHEAGPLDAHATTRPSTSRISTTTTRSSSPRWPARSTSSCSASTCCERAKSDDERAYLINREIDDIRGTIIRQTMFAEFEKITHAHGRGRRAADGRDVPERCTASCSTHYFGPDFAIDDELSLECFRIPHFYRAFYVYKYATGLSAAIALAERVPSGGKGELNDYLSFLKGGCSKYPLDLLRDAGVDMEQPEPVDTALAHFEQLVEELDELL